MTTKSVFPKLDALEAAARGKGRLAVAVAYPCSTDALAAAISAYEEGIIEPVLVGPRQRIEACASALKTSLNGFRIVEAEDDPILASRMAVALVGAGEVNAAYR
jgi:phosphate acetyltransferase